MFKNPFSFKGRIRRTEYALGYIIALGCVLVWSFLTSYTEESVLTTLILMLVFYWFTLAQGTKRCHDMGQSGFYQLIPFYGVVMLFSEGDSKANRYGENPKQPQSNVDPNTNNNKRWSIEIPKNKSWSLAITESITFALGLVLLICFMRTIPLIHPIVMNWIEGILLIGGYFLLLLYSYNLKSIWQNTGYSIFHRMIFTITYVITLSVYELLFTRVLPLDFAFFVNVIFDSIVVFIITYLPYILYKSVFQQKSAHVSH